MPTENLTHIIASKILDSPLNHVSNSRKKVYLKNGDLKGLVQFATVEFRKNDFIEPHEHKTMIEVFYVERGKVEVTIDNNSFMASAGDVIIAKNKHSFKFIDSTKLVYFGLENNA